MALSTIKSIRIAKILLQATQVLDIIKIVI